MVLRGSYGCFLGYVKTDKTDDVGWAFWEVGAGAEDVWVFDDAGGCE